MIKQTYYNENAYLLKSDSGKKLLEVETQRVYSEVVVSKKTRHRFHYQEI